jgi:hypothetical protein
MSLYAIRHHEGCSVSLYCNEEKSYINKPSTEELDLYDIVNLQYVFNIKFAGNFLYGSAAGIGNSISKQCYSKRFDVYVSQAFYIN